MSDLSKVVVSSSPHVRAHDDTRSIMADVLIALIPALIMGVYSFGGRALVLTGISIVSAVFFEWLYEKILKKPTTIDDLSACVTGLLLALNLPATAPVWLPVIGSGFAIIIVKMLYGGLGKNFMNPAMAARAFLFSWAVVMTTWVSPHTQLPLVKTPVDVVSQATALSQMKNGILPDVSLLDMALGKTPGSIGETCALALLAGGIYLVIRRVISARIPLAYIGTVALLTYLFPRGNDPFMWMMSSILSGGLFIAAIFMATDYATSPVTKGGQWVYGVGFGLLTVFIRYFGSYPEGVSYAILIMNLLVWVIDKAMKPKKFGYVRPPKKGGQGA